MYDKINKIRQKDQNRKQLSNPEDNRQLIGALHDTK